MKPILSPSWKPSRCAGQFLSATRPGCGSWPRKDCAGHSTRRRAEGDGRCHGRRTPAPTRDRRPGPAGLGCLRAIAERGVSTTSWTTGLRCTVRPAKRCPGRRRGGHDVNDACPFRRRKRWGNHPILGAIGLRSHRSCLPQSRYQCPDATGKSRMGLGFVPDCRRGPVPDRGRTRSRTPRRRYGAAALLVRCRSPGRSDQHSHFVAVGRPWRASLPVVPAHRRPVLLQERLFPDELQRPRRVSALDRRRRSDDGRPAVSVQSASCGRAGLSRPGNPDIGHRRDHQTAVVRGGDAAVDGPEEHVRRRPFSAL